LVITPMAGGIDAGSKVTVNGERDQPRNAVIQIDFNEAVNPSTVSGKAAEVSAYLRVVKIDTGANLSGKFAVSNQYRTVEFISDDPCGVNSCGEQIYCLPENSHLRVEIKAAALYGCTDDSDCAGREAFKTCTGGHCQNTATGEYYPLSASPLDGVADMALNSLDGNRVRGAEGPGTTYYSENDPSAGGGDSYAWSFYIGREIDLNAPKIIDLAPDHSDTGVSLSDPITIRFDKLMLSASLKTGATRFSNGRETAINKNINLWNFTGAGLGYWIAKENASVALPYTIAEIRHTTFADTTSYRAQVGSAVKDIYQNCFKPVSGPGCTGTDALQSCCMGAAINPTTVLPGANCP
jgi:hypothetical protein